MSSRVELTAYGFRWDDVVVERSASVVLRKGAKAYHSLTIKTPRRWVQVDLTPTGLLAGVKDFAAPRDQHNGEYTLGSPLSLNLIFDMRDSAELIREGRRQRDEQMARASGSNEV